MDAEPGETMFFLQFAQDLLKVGTGLSHPYMPALTPAD